MNNLKTKIIVLSFFYVIFFISACNSVKDDSGTIVITELPLVLEKIIENNKKIPSFSCQFSMSTSGKGKGISADGTAYIDKKRKRVKIILIDTLTEETLLDLVLIKGKIKIFIFNTKGGTIVRGRLSTLKLDRYFSNFNIDLKDLIDLVSGKSYIFKNAETMRASNNTKQHFYYLKKKNKTQLLSVNKSNGKIKQIVLLKGKSEVYRVYYKKYKEFKNFYFPKRSDFIHKRSKSKTIIHISKIRFNSKMSKSKFKLSKYPDARVISE